MMVQRNSKTRKEEENTTSCLFFRLSSMKSLFGFNFVLKLYWYNNKIHDPPTLTLSDDIVLSHILTRLPSKSLLRFSCVSKLWYNIIHHDPFFIASHYNHSKSKPSRVVIYAAGSGTHFKYLDQRLQGDQGASSSTLIANFRLDQRVYNSRYVIGSVNGLTCFRTLLLIEICNPSTHEILGILYPAKCEWIKPDDFLICCYGFGFDPLVNQYKLLWAASSVCQIYTLGNSTTQDCKWRDITVTSHLPLNEWKMNIKESIFIYSSGAFYRAFTGTNRIIMFDIHYEKFQVIPGLQVCDDRLYLYSICELRGCPYAVYRSSLADGHEFSLYALKKQQSTNSNVGSIQFAFELTVHFPFKTLTTYPTLSFTEYSGQILLQWLDRTKETHCYVYNPKKETLQKEVLGSSYGFYDALFVKHIDNLLSLKKLVPLPQPGAPGTGVKCLSSREATMHDEESSTTLSLKSILCCLGVSAKEDLQDMYIYRAMSRFKLR